MRPAELELWRQAERDRLVEARLRIPAEARRRNDRAILAGLEDESSTFESRTVSVYWPFRGEPDLRPFMERVQSRDGRLALPTVVERGKPLVFRRWEPGGPLEEGIWGIPVPPASAETVIPDLIIVPVVGFDPACYRLGYGGGYYDRTLAALPVRPRFVGVGYAVARVPTIHPQPHDVPLDMVVTEEGVTRR